MQRRTLHADEGRGARNVAAEARDLGQQILALEDLARVAQRQLHDLAALLPAQHRRRVLADVAGQHVGADRPAARRRQDQQPLDDIAQLPDVARPVVALQRGQRVLADRPRRQAGGIGDPLQEVGGELGDVLAALAERRHAQRHHIQAMIQLLAEIARRRSLPAGRGWSRRARGHRPRPGSCRRRARRTVPAARAPAGSAAASGRSATSLSSKVPPCAISKAPETRSVSPSVSPSVPNSSMLQPLGGQASSN